MSANNQNMLNIQQGPSQSTLESVSFASSSSSSQPNVVVKEIEARDYGTTQPKVSQILYMYMGNDFSGDLSYKYYKDRALKEEKIYATALDKMDIIAIKELLYNIAFNPEAVPLDQKIRIELARIKKDGGAAIHIDKELHAEKVIAIEKALKKYEKSSPGQEEEDAKQQLKDALSMHRSRGLFTLFAPASARVLPSMTEDSALLVASKKQ